LGPRSFARAMLDGATGLDELNERLGAEGARDRWFSDRSEADPQSLARAGRWWAAARAWELRGAIERDDRLEFARVLYAIGRFEDALEVLKNLRGASARVIRLWTLFRLGRLGPAAREIARTDSTRLTSRQRMQILAIAMRVFENRGDKKQVDSWLARGLAEDDPKALVRARLLAATSAWDRGDLERMRDFLELSREALDEPATAWRWHKAAGLEATARGDGEEAVKSFTTALRIQRRRLTPFEAGALWNELALGRAMADDLAGAEKALLHTLRLHREVQGSRSTTLAFFNLAEVRVRRGKATGVRDILERATTEDRRARNWRSLAHDFELWSRYELLRGRPHAALLRAREALDELATRGVDWHQEQLHALAARALGWLGRPEAARAELELANSEAMGEFEPEEVPAIWSLAGDREAALAAMAATPAGPLSRLWTLLLTGEEIRSADWRALDQLEPYRAARFVFDCELISPGTLPPGVVRRAVAALREAGAGPLAERLDQRDSTTWRAVAGFLAGSNAAEDAVDKLFIGAGYPDARLVVERAGRSDVVRDGRGGAAKLRRRIEGGDLVLEAPFIDDVQETLVALVAERLDPRAGALGSSNGADGAGTRSSSPIVGRSPELLEVLERAEKLGPVEVPILILGETGTGKELLAREVHRLSPRRDGPFLPVNCAAVSEELLMSDLFGHVRGSFTGAVRDRAGVFETARGGTVFLDEIGDLPLRAQGFLLRVLQEGEVRRVGESLPRATDVRAVAATNRNLEKMVKEGDFRADLYYRLRVGSLSLPPLRERGNDVIELAERFLSRDAPERRLTLAEDARRRLLEYAWPGNVRELRNTLSVAAAYAEGCEVGCEHLDLPYRAGDQARTLRSGGSEDAGIGYHEQVSNLRRRLVRDALREAGGNRAEAARTLGLTRQALSYLVRKLELDS